MKRALLLFIVSSLVALLLTSSAPARADATRITVSMTEFKFALSKKGVRKGTVSFKVVNDGAIAHDFKIKGKKTPVYEADKGGVLRVTFKKAGRYKFVCTLPGHEAAGMKGTLKVT